MRSKYIIISLCVILFSFDAEAQILKKLKKKVEQTTEKVLLKKTEQQTEKTVSGAIDSVVTPGNTGKPAANDTAGPSTSRDPNANKAKMVNTEAKRAFYTSDVVVRTSSKEKGKGAEYYFDVEELAVRGTAPDSEYPIYIDSEGFNYGFNKQEGRWEKTGIMKSDGMAFMMPAMSMGILQLPVQPTMDAAESLKNQGLNLNTFQLVEWVFIYKPEHFRNEDYRETKVPCPDSPGNCPKFLYSDSEYEGSWVLFDSKGRLSEIYANVKTTQAQGEGTYKFEYAPVSVNVPAAVEVKMPFQDLFLKGMDASVNEPGNTTNNTDESYDSGISNKGIKSMQDNMKNSDLGPEDLPATYDFDWRYRLKMDFVNQKKESFDLVFLLKKNVNYQGVSFENLEKGNNNEATMVFDLNINAMVMFMQAEQNKFLQIHPLETPKNSAEMDRMEIRELPAKMIIGYKSKGLEIENDKYIIQVYHSDETPIGMKNLFDFAGPMKMDIPDIDPRLVEQFSSGLIMEMTYKDKKKSKNDMVMSAQSIDQSKTTINNSEYQYMSFFGQMKPRQN